LRPFLAPAASPGPRPGAVPTFSVVITSYDMAGTIGEAVRSVLEQTVRPLEVIVSDDGSTDDVEGALEPYREGIVLLRGRHGGASAARNAGVAASSGDFVALLDGDDVYLPERLEALGELAAARPDLDLLTTDAYFEVDGETAGRFHDANPFEIADQRSAILERNFILGHAAVRRERLLAAGGFDTGLTWAGDWDCWIRLILAGAAAGLVDEPLSRYRIRDTSLSAARAESLRARVVVLEKHDSDPGLSEREREVLRAALERHDRRALVAEAEAALRGLRPGARRHLVPLLTRRGFGPGTRARAVAALVWPRAAGRWLARLESRTGRSRLRRSVPPARPNR
jgi:glycosyl transferase family 2